MRVLLCMLGLGLGLLGAAEVRMRDGRVLDGVVREDQSSERELALEVSSGRVSAILRLPRAEILAFDPAPSPRERALAEIDAAADALGPEADAAQWWALAERAAALDPIRHRELAATTLLVDRHHAQARASLGYQRHNGIWMLSHERAAAQGLVLHEGRWLPYQRFLALAQEEERRATAEESDPERRVQRIRRVRSYRSAYSYGCSLGLGAVFTGSYRGFRSTGPGFVPSSGTRAAGGRLVVPSGGGIVPAR